MKLMVAWIAFWPFSCFTPAAALRDMSNPWKSIRKQVAKRFERSKSTPASGRPTPVKSDSSDQPNEAHAPRYFFRQDGFICNAAVDVIRESGIERLCWAQSEEYRRDICTFYANAGRYAPECFGHPFPDRFYETALCFHKRAPMLAIDVIPEHKFVCSRLLADTCDEYLEVGRWDDGCFANYDRYRMHICFKVPTFEQCNQAEQGKSTNPEFVGRARRDFADADSSFAREDLRPENFNKITPSSYPEVQGSYAREDVRPPRNLDGQSQQSEYYTKRSPREYSGVHGSYAREDLRPPASKRSTFAGERQKAKESYPPYPGVNAQYARKEFTRPEPPSTRGTSSKPGGSAFDEGDQRRRGSSTEWSQPPPQATSSDADEQRRKRSSTESNQPPPAGGSSGSDAGWSGGRKSADAATNKRDGPPANEGQRKTINPEAEQFSESFLSSYLTMGQYVRRGVCIQKEPICGAKDTMRKTYRQAILAVHPDRNGCKNERDARSKNDALDAHEYCDRLVARFAQVQTSWESWSNMLIACAC
eukprot:TRINITY_DN6965_c0_g1_i1.p1 TRINITY_DN6965_c0_g1~~TRINITY_DN6965_c0_g1_i1.p1  ORF type:complete len:533 (-),score=40.53 TRINITY_DN6965_c0_g1_i1:242-1840(-)